MSALESAGLKELRMHRKLTAEHILKLFGSRERLAWRLSVVEDAISGHADQLWRINKLIKQKEKKK